MIIYIIGDGQAEGRAEMKNLLCGKGANLAEMISTGLPVTTSMGATMYLVFPVQKYFFLELLAGYAISSTQKTEITCPPYRY